MTLQVAQSTGLGLYPVRRKVEGFTFVRSGRVLGFSFRDISALSLICSGPSVLRVRSSKLRISVRSEILHRRGRNVKSAEHKFAPVAWSFRTSIDPVGSVVCTCCDT